MYIYLIIFFLGEDLGEHSRNFNGSNAKEPVIEFFSCPENFSNKHFGARLSDIINFYSLKFDK